MQLIGGLFGGQKGPSAGEKALQRDREQAALRNDAESEARAALATRAASLRRSLGYRDDEKKGTLG